MANAKISELPALTTAEDADLLAIVDTSATTTKKITFSNFKASLDVILDNNNNLYSSDANVPGAAAQGNIHLGTDTGSTFSVGNLFNIYIGDIAGTDNTGVGGQNIGIGRQALNGATNVVNTIGIGLAAGNLATDAMDAIFIGQLAGRSATDARKTIGIGFRTAEDAANAENSVFIGPLAGFTATNASSSIFLGYGAGYEDTVDNTVSGTSICIGVNSGTGGFKDSIALGSNLLNTEARQVNIGNVLYIRDIYNVGSRTGNPVGGAKVGINTNDPDYAIDVIGDINVNGLFRINGAALPSYTFADSVQNTADTINLVGDVASPGNEYYYGTDSGGTKGFFQLPAGLVNYWALDVDKVYNSSGDKVGINNVNPTEALDVTGNGLFSGNVTAAEFIGGGASLTGITVTQVEAASSITPVADNTYTFDTNLGHTQINITTQLGIITAITIS